MEELNDKDYLTIAEARGYVAKITAIVQYYNAREKKYICGFFTKVSFASIFPMNRQMRFSEIPKEINILNGEEINEHSIIIKRNTKERILVSIEKDGKDLYSFNQEIGVEDNIDDSMCLKIMDTLAENELRLKMVVGKSLENKSKDEFEITVENTSSFTANGIESKIKRLFKEYGLVPSIGDCFENYEVVSREWHERSVHLTIE
jgi:hypothetical protein